MEKDWICIFTTQKSYVAEMAKSILDQHDIEAVIINKQDSSYLVIGEQEIFVKAEHVIRAKYLLNNLES